VAQLWIPETPEAEPYPDRFAPGLDQCASGRFETTRGPTVDLSGSSALLTSSGGLALALSHDSELGMLDTEISSGELDAGATFDITLHQLWGLPDVTLPAVAETPPPFAIATPDLDRSSPAWVEIDELAFTWTPGGADAIALYIARVDGDDGTVSETLTCLATDDGAFTIPPSAWAGWEYRDDLYVYVGDLRERTASVPLNNGTSSVVGISWVVGVLRAW
jgi:hypothetical protein